ncbi:ScbA/BarX family gamma-butyrolactone biosynthesis protein [Streptomyces sp. NPDC058000]|uniref:ScbA/BarX family gamma-butyrolactone biosynthesis protein n=1 Tax=Streptomyces sp. NPDC058000 TaxID=3346299 RepID=UPI0036E83992
MLVLTAHHSQTATAIPRQYVHKAAQSEVLLTGWQALADDSFLITAQWPRAHAYYAAAGGRHDPMLLAETVRQAVPLLSHLGYDVPFGHRQIWDHLTWTADPAALSCAPVPAEIEMHVRCSDVTRRAGRLAALRMDIALTRDGAPLGTAHTRFTSQAPQVYTRMRGPYADLEQALARCVPLAPPAPPRRAGRTRFADVVLSPSGTAHRFQLRVDLNHPVLFDHPVDHAPGMLLLEAARQAAHEVLHPRQVRITGMESVFHRYVEFDAPCWIESEVLGTGPGEATVVRVTASQHGHEAFTATVTAS